MLRFLVGTALVAFLVLVVAGVQNKDDPWAYVSEFPFQQAADSPGEPGIQVATPSDPLLQERLAMVRKVDVGTGFFLFFETDTGAGTAFHISPTILVTAGHVASAAAEEDFHISSGDRVSYVSHLVGSNGDLDVALLEPNQQLKPDPEPVFTLATGQADIGENVWGACAYPRPELLPLVVEALDSPVTLRGDVAGPSHIVPHSMTLSGGVHSGCSGGPIIDAEGNVVGVMVGGGQGQTFAAPSALVLTWLTDQRFLQ